MIAKTRMSDVPDARARSDATIRFLRRKAVPRFAGTKVGASYSASNLARLYFAYARFSAERRRRHRLLFSPTSGAATRRGYRYRWSRCLAMTILPLDDALHWHVTPRRRRVFCRARILFLAGRERERVSLSGLYSRPLRLSSLSSLPLPSSSRGD